jgi:hypothetical protein
VVDQVARALCDAAGRSHEDALGKEMRDECVTCDKQPDGTLVCTMWTSFRQEARAAICAAYLWHKKERRWPSFASGQ